MADWLKGVDLLDPEAVAAAARPVMAAMTNPNGLDRAAMAWGEWEFLSDSHPDFANQTDDEWEALTLRVGDALEAVGLDLMDSKDWCESATGVRA